MEFKKLLLFLFASLLPGYVLAAIGITQDETPYGYYHWSTALHFNVDEDTVTSQLPSLARAAYEEMITDARDKDLTDSRTPSTMSAFAVGSSVYFSSGLIGAPFLVNPGSVENYVQEGVAEEVSLAIIRSQQSYSNEHRYNMRCAEPLAIQQFLVNNPQSSVIGRGRISTYGVLDPNDTNNVGIINPCGLHDGKWGCQVFLDKLQVRVIGNQGDVPDLPSIQSDQTLAHCFWT